MAGGGEIIKASFYKKKRSGLLKLTGVGRKVSNREGQQLPKRQNRHLTLAVLGHCKGFFFLIGYQEVVFKILKTHMP